MGVADTQRGMLPAKTESAMCVQNFDDSRSLAIRITYRISLRSSSLWEPRHPLLKVVFTFAFVGTTTNRTHVPFIAHLHISWLFIGIGVRDQRRHNACFLQRASRPRPSLLSIFVRVTTHANLSQYHVHRHNFISRLGHW